MSNRHARGYARTPTRFAGTPVPTVNSVRAIEVGASRLVPFSDRMIAILVALLGALRSGLRSRLELEAEILALRHQLAVLQRAAPKCLRLRRADRLFWVVCSTLWPNWRQAVQIVRPATVVRWHRRGFAIFWRWKSRPRRAGRPPVAPDLRALIRQMSEANPLWGAPPIHGERLKLGLDVSQTTVTKYLAWRHPPPSPRWRAFLQNHVSQLASMDFFMVPTATFRVRRPLA
jgi:putative transposase